MLKGHVQIDLHNHKTGLKDRIEQNNLITNAVDYLTPFLISGGADLTSELFPLYQRKLGGIMLFNKQLTENKANVHFPSNAQLVGWAGRTQTFDPQQGSLNTQESEITNTGVKQVWDFATNQANGIIRSVALTDVNYNSSYSCVPWRSVSDNFWHRLYNSNGANYEGLPIAFKDNYFYYMLMDGNTDVASQSHTVSIYKQYVPINYLKIADSINSYGKDELVDTITIESTESRTSFWRYYSVDNGYIYFAYVSQYGEGVDGVITYRRVSIDEIINDGTATLSQEYTLTLAGVELTDWIPYAFGVADGRIYVLGLDEKHVYSVNLADGSDVIDVSLPGDFVSIAMGYSNFLKMSPKGPVCVSYVKSESGANPYKYYRGYIYTDGTFVSDREPFAAQTVKQNNIGATQGQKFISENLIVPVLHGFGWQNAGMVLHYAPNYLGSICNLSQAIQKTTTTSMKVTYTLTDATE